MTECPQAATKNSPTLCILSTSVLIFACYFTIGLQLAVVPDFVHLGLGYNAVLAGLAVSVQYAATLASRPVAGRESDTIGAKRTTCWGLLVCGVSGVLFLSAGLLKSHAHASLAFLLLSRLTLGFGESWVATGGTLWGLSRLGTSYEAKVIAWSGIASFGALAVGAPLGVWVEHTFGVAAIGVVSVAVATTAAFWARVVPATPARAAKMLAFAKVLKAVLPDGLALAFGGIGFGTIAAFIALYFGSRHWDSAGLALSLFGASFVLARLLFADMINKWGGYPVAIVSLTVESVGLTLLWLASAPMLAQAGAAVAGFGFSLVFPALGVEAVRKVPLESRGSALGVYTAFLDLSLGISGPVAGIIDFSEGYQPIFLFAAVMASLSVALLLAGRLRLRPHGLPERVDASPRPARKPISAWRESED